MERPRSARQRFAWLLRTLRAYHSRPDVRNTEEFCRNLNRFLAIPLKPATLNRLENAELPYTVEKAQAYERALNLPTFYLADVYVYLMRREGRHIDWGAGSRNPLEGKDYDLLYQVIRDGHLSADQWAYLAMRATAPHSRLMESVRFRDAICLGVLQALGTSYEREERLLLEALISLGDVAVPYILEYVRADPSRYFNAIEVLGFIQTNNAWNGLINLADGILDGVSGQTLLKPIRRRISCDPTLLTQLAERAPGIAPYCIETLLNMNEAFTTREEALALLNSANLYVDPKARRLLNDYREDLQQLRLRPVGLGTRDLLHQLINHFREVSAFSNVVALGLPEVVPGLSDLLGYAVFYPERMQRQALASTLAPLGAGPQLTQALGMTLLRSLDARDYGVQRSIIRLMTKMGHNEAHRFFSQFAETRIQDQGVRLSITWALGCGSLAGDDVRLQALAEDASPTTRRVIVIAAERRGYRAVLESRTADPDPSVASEASKALHRLLSSEHENSTPRE